MKAIELRGRKMALLMEIFCWLVGFYFYWHGS